MQFIDKFNWGFNDFIIIGILLLGAGITIKFATERFTKPIYNIIVVTVIIAIFLLIWIELAVGIFGTPWAGS